MKLGKLVNPQFKAALNKLAAQDLPLRTAFKLKGVIKTTNDELQKYDNVRTEALHRFGDKDEKGNLINLENGSVKLSDDNMKQFVSELNELLSSEVNMIAIKVGELGEKVNLSASELFALEDVLTD
jgi:hypothetical protein